MGFESATYISQLVATNPTGTDDYSTADDHIRLLKTVLQAQFPNFNAAAVDATPAELNILDGATLNVNDLNLLAGRAADGLTTTELSYLKNVTSDIQAQLDALVPSRKVKTSDTSRASTTTLANDPHILSFSLGQSKLYAIRGILHWQFANTSNGGLRIQMTATTAPESSQIQYQYRDSNLAGAHVVAKDVSLTGLLTTNETVLDLLMNIHGIIRASDSAAATLNLQWAQSSVNAVATVLKEGSFVELVELG